MIIGRTELRLNKKKLNNARLVSSNKTPIRTKKTKPSKNTLNYQFLRVMAHSGVRAWMHL
jgi:hypothetical protein